VLAGFTFTSLVTIVCSNRFDLDKPAEYIYECTAVITFMTFFHILLQSTMIGIWGPRLALTGPQGSMELSISKMLSEQNRLLAGFFFGILMFNISAICMSWSAFANDAG
jgi:hypothetical protein